MTWRNSLTASASVHTNTSNWKLLNFAVALSADAIRLCGLGKRCSRRNCRGLGLRYFSTSGQWQLRERVNSWRPRVSWWAPASLALAVLTLRLVPRSSAGCWRRQGFCHSQRRFIASESLQSSVELLCIVKLMRPRETSFESSAHIDAMTVKIRIHIVAHL